MYTCGKIEKLLDTYTDGELDQPRRLVVEAHLQGCALCSRLVRGKEEEAQLIRSGDPVPALSAGFTAQVMSNLTRSDSRARWEGFFSLRRLLARPWLAPALAALMLLVTVSWAASRHLLPASLGQVAFQNSVAAGRVAQIPKTPVSSGNNSQAHQDVLAPGLPQEPGWEDARGSSDKKELGIGAGSANIKEPTGDEGIYGPESSRAIVPSPQENKGAAAETFSPGSMGDTTMAPQPASPAPQPKTDQELEQQGYPVFEPHYLPPDYSLATCSPQPPDPGSSSTGGTRAAAPHPGPDSLLFTYRNAQTGGWITLAIQPLNDPAPPPVTTSAKATENQASGAPASANPTGSQPTGTDQITWQAPKNGASFLLTLSGNLPGDELKRVAASVH